jgi:hypothetical protein
MQDLKHLIDVAFLPGERCCPSTGKYGYHSVPIEELYTGQVTLVSPHQKIKNKTVNTNELIFMAINPMKSGFRTDQNISAYRNFLFEIDTGSLHSQLEYCKKLGIPTSCAVFSGRRSLHFLVCLDEALSEKSYRLLYQWALNIGTLFDQNVKVPSKSVRIPGTIRPDTGKEQKLIYLNGKVKLSDFTEWLNNYEDLRPKLREKTKCLTNEENPDKLSPWVKSMIKNKQISFEDRGRNVTWYSVFYDFALAGYSEDKAIDVLRNFFNEEHDFKEREWLACANSAYKNVAK